MNQLVTRLLLFTDEPLLAKGLETILKSRSDFELVATCPQVLGIAEAVAASQPDILLVDLTPEVTFQQLRGLRNQFPGTRIVLWAHSIRTEVAYQALEQGIRGIVRKTLPVEAMIACLEIVAAGGQWFDEAMKASLHTLTTVRLTLRESQLVSLLTAGRKNKQIATALFLSEGTVRVYLSRLFQKLGVKDRFELAVYGLKNMPGTKVASGAEWPQAARPQSRVAGGAPFFHKPAMGSLALGA